MTTRGEAKRRGPPGASGHSASSAPWIDISLPIAPGAIAWSGLDPARLESLARRSEGAAVNVGRLDCCLHTGTHADAPWHVLDGGATVDRLDPALFIGPAQVLRTEDPDAISIESLRAAGLREGEAGGAPLRLLIATPRPYDGRQFPETIPHLSPEAARWLVSLGLRLVGVNVPSLDPLDSRAMESHRVVFAAGAGILENLDLSTVEPGAYELFAAPIRISGADAAPVRALLRPRGEATGA